MLRRTGRRTAFPAAMYAVGTDASSFGKLAGQPIKSIGTSGPTVGDPLCQNIIYSDSRSRRIFIPF